MLSMNLSGRALHVILIALSLFLAVSAIPGGIALLAGFNAPPLEMLAGSVFTSFTIPGLALLLLVGGSAALAAALLIRKSSFAVISSIAAGLVVMAFELVEVLAIGSPAGPSRVMQILYFGVGAALVAASAGVLLLDLRLAHARRESQQDRS
jgi:hypothetical protein